MLADRLAHRAEDHPGLGQLLLEGGHHRDAVEHRVDRVLGRALNAGQNFLLLQGDAELCVGGQKVRIDLVQAGGAILGLGRGVVVGVLVVDRRELDLGPGRLLQGQPALERLQPPLQHPFRLVLLGRDEADDVGVQALGRELLVDVGDEAVLVALQRLDGLDSLLDGGHAALLPTRPAGGGAPAGGRGRRATRPRNDPNRP